MFFYIKKGIFCINMKFEYIIKLKIIRCTFHYNNIYVISFR